MRHRSIKQTTGSKQLRDASITFPRKGTEFVRAVEPRESRPTTHSIMHLEMFGGADSAATFSAWSWRDVEPSWSSPAQCGLDGFDGLSRWK
ncbi:hypothetical protein PG985_007847 [Apiospora marii]|uniref:uncharacterized protein n=1 Tax=Apiospora marii TaxID=335849 RepID=UPI00312FC438